MNEMKRYRENLYILRQATDTNLHVQRELYTMPCIYTSVVYSSSLVHAEYPYIVALGAFIVCFGAGFCSLYLQKGEGGRDGSILKKRPHSAFVSNAPLSHSQSYWVLYLPITLEINITASSASS